MNKYRAITGIIDLCTALHIGTGHGDAATDAVCRQNSCGQWIIPGTALGGALRSLATRLAPRCHDNGLCRALLEDSQQNRACDCIVCELFGFRFLDANPESKSRPSASRIHTADAVAIEQTHSRIRDGVGINRTNLSAERQGAAKFDFEVVPAGTKFAIRIELEDGLSADHEMLLAAVLSEWQAGRATLGGRSARGLGRFVLREFSLVTRQLSSATGLVSFLKSDAPWLIDSQDGDEPNADVSKDLSWSTDRCRTFRERVRPNFSLPEPVAGSFCSIELNLKCDGPMVVNDPAAAALAGYEFVPYVEQLQHGSQLVLPGASIRGVLRSQAERIARTIASHYADGSQNASDEFLSHCPACDPLQNNKKQAPLASCQLLVKDYAKAKEREDAERTNAEEGFDPEQVPLGQYCPACQLFGSTYFGSRLRCEDAHTPYTHFHAQDFLKIDRFTGGGIDGAKFDAIAAWEPEFTLRIFLENPRAEELAWLSFVLRDLREGLLRLGFGGAKGFGRVYFEEATLRLGYLHESDLKAMLQADDVVANLAQSTKDGLYDVLSYRWDDWLRLVKEQSLVTKFLKRLQLFDRRQEFALAGKKWNPMQLQADSYFKVPAAPGSQTLLSQVYPLQRAAQIKPSDGVAN